MTAIPLFAALANESVSNRIDRARDREADRVRARLVPGAIDLAAEFGLPVEDCAAALSIVNVGTARQLALVSVAEEVSLGAIAHLLRHSDPVVTLTEQTRSLGAVLVERARAQRDDLILAKFEKSPAPRNRAERRTAERAARRKAGRP